MSAILIKSGNKQNDLLLFQLAKAMKMPIRILDKDDEMDVLLIKSIDEGMKSGEAPAKEVEKFMKKHGTKVHK
jgi:hypothetical protein